MADESDRHEFTRSRVAGQLDKQIALKRDISFGPVGRSDDLGKPQCLELRLGVVRGRRIRSGRA